MIMMMKLMMMTTMMTMMMMMMMFQGVCISADSGPVCECRNIDWQGEFCQIGQYLASTWNTWGVPGVHGVL